MTTTAPVTGTTLYRIYDRFGALLYVGITDHYERRMRQHSEKAWWVDCHKILREEFDTREEASAAELKAIAGENPAHNRIGRDGRPKPRYVPKAGKFRAPDPLLNQAEAAEYLGVTERTIRNYVSRGDLPASRIKGSRAIRFRLSRLDAMLRPIPSGRSI